MDLVRIIKLHFYKIKSKFKSILKKINTIALQNFQFNNMKFKIHKGSVWSPRTIKPHQTQSNASKLVEVVISITPTTTKQTNKNRQKLNFEANSRLIPRRANP